jgi:hypothetical protein
MNGSNKNTKKFKVNSNQLVLALTGLLAGQLILTGAVFMSKFPMNNSETPVLSFDPKTVSKIVIEEGSANGDENNQSHKRLDLIMTARADWKIPCLADFPASSDMIHQTLDSLLEVKKGLPIGTTNDAQERNRVSPKNFFRAVTLFNGDKMLGKIYIGNTLADKKTTFRNANDSSVYTDTLSPSRFSANPNYWIDSRAASIKLKKIESIDMGYFRLDNLDESWNLVEGTKTELLNTESVLGLVYPVANCKIVYVLDPKIDSEIDLAQPVISFKVRLKDRLVRLYKISKAKKSENYIVSISGFPWICVVDKRTVEKIVAWNPASLRRQQHLSTSKPKGVDLKSLLKRKMDETLQSVDHDVHRNN